MKKFVLAAVVAALVGGPLWADGKVFTPADGKSFEITDKDVVRLTGPAPGSTGFTTTVKVTEGEATVHKRSVYSVVNGKVLTIGGGRLEFDVKPKAGKTGKVKVIVTLTPPGRAPEVKEYEFEVK